MGMGEFDFAFLCDDQENSNRPTTQEINCMAHIGE
jgi:hypothetical protein